MKVDGSDCFLQQLRRVRQKLGRHREGAPRPYCPRVLALKCSLPHSPLPKQMSTALVCFLCLRMTRTDACVKV